MHVETYAVAALEQHERPDSRTGTSHARATAVRILICSHNKQDKYIQPEIVHGMHLGMRGAQG